MDGTVGIVLPAFRVDTDRTVEYIRDIRDRIDPDRILVELDAAGPETIARLREVAEVNHVPRRRGKGRAVRDGFDRLDTDLLLFTDADGSVPPHSVERVLDVVGKGPDIVTGCRRHPDTMVSHSSMGRKLVGDVFAWTARRLVRPRLRDYQAGVKAVHRDCWEELDTDGHRDGFAWDLELLTDAHARGHTIEEIPVDWSDVPGSTVAFRDIVSEFVPALLDVRDRY